MTVTGAMVLAAGYGKRLRPLTDTIPKPLVEVGGVAMIDRTLDSLARAGIGRAVVNTHHLADKVAAHVGGRARPEVTLSPEPALLDTGGGVANALGDLGDGPFYVLNSDVIVLDGVKPVLARLAEAWDDAAMDVLLLVHPAVRAFGYNGRGDFAVAADGTVTRRREREIAAYVFSGWQLLHPRLFEGCPEGPFSLNLLYDRAIETGRLRAIAHDGAWLHVGTPEALKEAERRLRELL